MIVEDNGVHPLSQMACLQWGACLEPGGFSEKFFGQGTNFQVYGFLHFVSISKTTLQNRYSQFA